MVASATDFSYDAQCDSSGLCSCVLAVNLALGDPARLTHIEGKGVDSVEFTCAMNGVSVSVKCDDSVVKNAEGGAVAPPSHDKIAAFIGTVISGAHGLFAAKSRELPAKPQPSRGLSG